MATFKRNFEFNDDIMKTISANIRKYRHLAGITQEQLAVDIEKSYDFVRRLEFKKGEVGCSIQTLNRIATVLNTDVGNFFKSETK